MRQSNIGGLIYYGYEQLKTYTESSAQTIYYNSQVNRFSDCCCNVTLIKIDIIYFRLVVRVK